MKILYINHHKRSKVHFEKRALAMAKYLNMRGHELTILVTADKNKMKVHTENINGVTIIEIPDLLKGKLRSGWDIWSGINRYKYLKNRIQNFDIIHVFESRPMVVHPLVLALKGKRIPVVVDWVDWLGRGGMLDVLRPRWYNILFGRLETFYEEHYKKKFQGVTVICNALQERAINLGIEKDGIFKIPVGCDLELVDSIPSKEESRRELNINSELKIITYSGVDAIFDLPIVLQAICKIKESYPNVRLMITGNATPKIEQLINEYNLSDFIILTGFIDYSKFYTYLSCSDIFVLPVENSLRNHGRWPSKINDYLLSGRPVVSNAVGDLEELFKSYTIGLTADFTADDFAQKITLLFEDKKLYVKTSTEAKNVAQNILSWPILVEGLEKFYYKMMEA